MTDNDEKPVYYTTSEAAQELQIPEHELRYWENRFDKEQLMIFMAAMEAVMLAMFEEPSARRLSKHLPEELYPKHTHVSAAHLNELAGYELVDKTMTDDIKVYVLDQRYLKKPYGAWGELFIMDTQVKNAKDSVRYPYGDGILYNTGIVARILPDGELDFLERSGRTVLWESPKGWVFPDLKKIEDALCSVKGVKDAEAWIGFYDEAAMKIAARVEADGEIKEELLQKAVADQVGEDYVPSMIFSA